MLWCLVTEQGWVKAKRNLVSEEGPFWTCAPGCQQLTSPMEQRDRVPTGPEAQRAGKEPTFIPNGPAPSPVQLTPVPAGHAGGRARLGVVCAELLSKTQPCRVRNRTLGFRTCTFALKGGTCRGCDSGRSGLRQ